MRRRLLFWEPERSKSISMDDLVADCTRFREAILAAHTNPLMQPLSNRVLALEDLHPVRRRRRLIHSASKGIWCCNTGSRVGIRSTNQEEPFCRHSDTSGHTRLLSHGTEGFISGTNDV